MGGTRKKKKKKKSARKNGSETKQITDESNSGPKGRARTAPKLRVKAEPKTKEAP